jgi:pyoverdine/dityrosine biosynthesis protein Dit1
MALYITVGKPPRVKSYYPRAHWYGTIDLLGVPDRSVWSYGETLRQLARTKDFKHVAFSRLRDLVKITLPDELDEMAYVANASNFRRALLNEFSDPNWEWKEVRQNEDVCLTYRGYIKFLETDLENVYPQGPLRSKSKYKRGIEYIAKQMLARGHVSHHFSQIPSLRFPPT